MKYCNCGAVMKRENIFEKIYTCPKCCATLQIDKRGIQRFYTADGTHCTYQPKIGTQNNSEN